MKQFLLPEPPDADGVVRLSGADYRYLARVRRLSAGAVFTALLPDGTKTRALVQAVTAESLVCECLDIKTKVNADHLPPLALFQSLPKGTKIDLIVRQAAEAGVSEIAPFVSAYSVPPLPKPGTEKTERWRRIIREARQQSGSAIDTVIKPVCDLDGLFAYWENVKVRYQKPVGVLLHQAPLEQGSLHQYLKDEPDFVAAAVGPEGGFSNEEAQQFMDAGFKPLVLGRSVLRCETAALYAVAAIHITLLEITEWTLKPLL
jgi:16S rRNA (uracil1498-N3)-methyltransferase